MNELTSRLASRGGRLCGWRALETIRVERGIPRFGADMDETNLAPEAIDERAISYSKGCYIGQEVIARVRTYGQVAKSLQSLKMKGDDVSIPRQGREGLSRRSRSRVKSQRLFCRQCTNLSLPWATFDAV